jgi:hypothetical protein
MKHNLAPIQEAVVQLSSDPLNPRLNFITAVAYDDVGQTAAATGLYLRAAEYGYESEPFIAYVSLIKIASCMDRQQDRNHTAKNNLLQAIALLPERPEAYFFLSQYYERQKAWQECYTTAEIGLSFVGAPVVSKTLYEQLERSGFKTYGLTFEKAVSSWWIGRTEESKHLFEVLLGATLDPEYAAACRANLDRIK